jgi:hypothetical protein
MPSSPIALRELMDGAKMAGKLFFNPFCSSTGMESQIEEAAKFGWHKKVEKSPMEIL